MLHEFSRQELLIGQQGTHILSKSKVAIFGIGGVGSFTVEALARCGIGHFVLIDDDRICLTNINRQLHATHKTVGQPKVEAMKQRILDINPKAEVETHQVFYLPNTAEDLVRTDYDYLVDAIDTVSAKIDLVVRADQMQIPMISCMGAGNKMDPTQFEVADIYKTSVCPLCKVMRSELRKRDIPQLKVVYSKEPALEPLPTESSSCRKSCICPKGTQRTCTHRRNIPGSMAFVPSVAGLIIAGEVVKDLLARGTNTTDKEQPI